jgi:hypothetical protein
LGLRCRTKRQLNILRAANARTSPVAVHHAEDHQIPAVRCKPRLPRIYGCDPAQLFSRSAAEQSPADGAGAPYRCCRDTTPRSNTASQSCIAAQNTPGSISTRNELSHSCAAQYSATPTSPLADFARRYTALQHEHGTQKPRRPGDQSLLRIFWGLRCRTKQRS